MPRERYASYDTGPNPSCASRAKADTMRSTPGWADPASPDRGRIRDRGAAPDTDGDIVSSSASARDRGCGHVRTEYRRSAQIMRSGRQ